MDVNFVFQVRSFHRYKREVQLSANAQALWLELFGLFNECRFPDVMPVSTTHLSSMLAISKDGVIRARKELIDNGLLEIVGARKGRQHTTVRIKYFEIAPVQMKMAQTEEPAYSANTDKVVDNPVENPVDIPGNEYPGDICDAHDDANCDANDDTCFCDAYGDANCDTKTVCDANCVDICGTYINNKQCFKPKEKDTYKEKRSPYGDIKKSLSYCGGTSRATRTREGEELCYNSAWRTDAKARARTAQNVIDALGTRQLEHDLNATLCRYMQLGVTPEMALDALRKAPEETDANDALNEAAFRLGIYHAGQESGLIDVRPETLHALGGDIDRARRHEERQMLRHRRDAILMCIPGYRRYLSELRDADGKLNDKRCEERRQVNEKIERLLTAGLNSERIIAAIHETEGYKAYANEHEQELSEQQKP